MATTGKVITQIKLGELIEQIGLVASKKPLVGRSLADYKAGPADQREVVKG